MKIKWDKVNKSLNSEPLTQNVLGRMDSLGKFWHSGIFSALRFNWNIFCSYGVNSDYCQMKAFKKALGFQNSQARRPTAEQIWCWHGRCCGFTRQVVPWSQMCPCEPWVSHSSGPGTRPAPKHARCEASLASQWPAGSQRGPGILSSFIKTQQGGKAVGGMAWARL